MRYFRLYALGLGFVILSVVWAWNKIDLTLNYAPVAGTVTAVDQMCRVEQEGNILERPKSAPIEMTCDQAVAAVQTGRRFQGDSVAFGTNILYSYVSPVDHAAHSGKMWRNSEVALGAPPLSVVIYASRTKAGISKFVMP